MARSKTTAARAAGARRGAKAPKLEVIDRRAGADRRQRARRRSDRLALVEESFAALAPRGEALVARFYERLLERHPEVRPLFEGVDLRRQAGKLLAALRLVVENLRRPDELARTLHELGRRHQGHGVRPEHYPLVAGTLLEVLAEFAGRAWTRPVADAWAEALDGIARTMLEAYEDTEEGAMAAASPNPAAPAGAGAGVVDDLEVLKDILEHAPINIMIADADERIVFVNRRAREVLESLEDELAKYLPGFRADEVVGGSIHRYHRDPDAVRRILQGLRPGEPRRGEITPGPFVFEHETRVLVDRAGNRIGYVVQWHDVTEKRQKEEQAQRLQRAVDGAQTAMMTIDRDLVITYVNEETRRLMRRHAEVLRRLYPGFDPENLVGQCIDQFHENPAHQRRLLADPNNLPHEADIEVGPLTFHIRVSAIHDLKGNYVGNTLEWSDVTELRRREQEVARLQSAVDGAETALMLCDEQGVITYVNPAVVQLLERRREQLQRVWPGFDPRKLVGRNIDEFHRNPAHQQAILRDPSRLPYRGHIELLDLEFEINATAILDRDGRYMGNMVEWKDVTEQKDAERQVQSLIEAAARGELDRRLEVERYEGFMRGLAEGVNAMLDAVVTPLKAAIQALQALAEGDLTVKMEGEYQGAYAALQEAINGSLANVLRMVGRIREASASIATAAAEIAQGNADLSQRTEEQASSLEETASSMEEMTSTVKQNADNARQANQLAAGAREQAEKGGEVVGAAVAAMGEINQASKKIADIIGVIDEIAFQTNLLALNAAVEAARAGEQGRGFAVVAAEVRNLAQRSAAAAKEIKGLIKDSVEKVEEGTRLVDASGKTLEEIVAAVKKVSDIVAEIAAASQEQSVGIEQVNKAIMQLDEATQQNAALVEETAAASQSMDEQAKRLGELMDFFRTGEEGEAASAPAPAPARPPRAPARPARKAPAARRRPAAAPADEGDDWEEF